MTVPILRAVPESFETARLLVRCPRPGDGSVVHAAVVESLNELRAFGASLPWAMHPPSVEASEIFCREAQASYLRRSMLPMLLFSKEDGELIGSSGLHGIEWALPKFEIGYWCRTSRTGQGFITEAVRAITTFALEELDARRVECTCDERNAASRRVCERAGYVLEGVRRHDKRDPDGEVRNTCVYAVTR